MKLFLLKVSLFLVPLAIIFVPCYLYLSKYQEIDSYEEMVRQNQSEERLIGLAYSDPGYRLKQRVIAYRKPTQIALGTSRVLQFRDYFFRDPESFYNCGRSVKKIKDYRAFLESYPTSYPDFIIVGVDQDLFNANFDDLEKSVRDYKVVDLELGDRFIKTSKSLLKSYRKGEIDQSSLKSDKDIGVNGKLHATGFRADGSYQYGNIIGGQLESDDYQFKTTLGRLAANKKRFAQAEEINDSAVEEFERFLVMCREKGIEVIVFLPPYASKIYDKVGETPKKYPHIFGLLDALKPVCEKQEVSIYDYSNMKDFNSNNFESIDGFHGSEVCYLRLLIDLAEKNQVVAKRVDIERCRVLLKNSYSSRQVIREIEEVNPKPVVDAD